MNPNTPAILRLSDAGHVPAAIAKALQLPVGTVYAVLRAERPNRKRAPRTRTSEIPARVRALAAAGVGAARIAALCECSRAYVYRILAESR